MYLPFHLKFIVQGTIIFVVLICCPVLRSYAVEEKRFSYIIQLPENENAIVVEKKTQQLFVLSNHGNRWEKKFHAACSTGEVGGVKRRAGDKKTPEGIYFIKDEYEDRYLTPVYGKRAFPIDYPNFIDKQDGKNGSAIWIHGTNKKLKPMDSNGCIALENKNVVKLSDLVTLDSTPVILVEEIEFAQNQNDLATHKELINSLLKNWSRALTAGTYQEYLSFYSPLYLPDIGFWRDWINIRIQAKHQAPVKIDNENIGIYYHNNIFVAIFEQVATVADRSILLGKRKLFLTREQGSFAIIGDVYQSIPDSLIGETAPLVSALETVLAPHLAEDKVIRTIKTWLAAWSNKDMNTYASFYAENFYSDGMNKTQWVGRKKKISKKYNYINVTGNGFQVKFKNNECRVRFSQKYDSSAFTAKGTKQLNLIRTGGSWKIFQESWKKK